MENTQLSENTKSLTLQMAYKSAVEEWIAAIREEEALASVHPSVAHVDTWQAAHFKEEEARDKALKAKQEYENAIRENLFGF